MSSQTPIPGKGVIYRRIAVFLGILLNCVLAYLTWRLRLPFYMDTPGTIAVSALAGSFPGIVTAMATNIVCSLFNPDALYFSILNVLIALTTSWFARKDLLKRPLGILGHLLLISAIGGILGTCMQWLLLQGPQFADVAHIAGVLFGSAGVSYFVGTVLIGFVLNLVDKGIGISAAILILHFVPEGIRDRIRKSYWKQTPLSTEDIRREKKAGRSLERDTSVMLATVAFVLAVIISWISIKLYYEDLKKQYSENAQNAARFAADIVDGDRVEDYIRDGEEAEGYLETKRLLTKIRDSAPAVEYLYVIRVGSEHCTAIFDVETEDTPGWEPGELVPIEESFEPYLEQLLAGDEIELVESNESFGWLLTVYHPVRNSAGKTVCYAGADVSMNYLSDYTGDFLLKALFIFSGFFVLVVGFGLTYSVFRIVYPINSITAAAKSFAEHGQGIGEIDKKVREMRAIKVHTDDEVEELYAALCRMEADMAEQVRELSYYADVTSKMQNGLIITMADMVENRDSDTGAHVQKTAAYVHIILEGLKKKGYYPEKLTPRYMVDVEMSAPLHDVGKINIPDAILNKPGKLTEEEYEIMKTHTTAGKKILENAISTVEGENYLKEARNMAAYHHERWDGKGYPDGIHGEVIPLSARVMAVADVFDALTSPRVYKPGFPLEKALQILREGAGTQFDAKCVEVFLEALPEVKRVLRKFNGTDA